MSDAAWMFLGLFALASVCFAIMTNLWVKEREFREKIERFVESKGWVIEE